MTTMIMERIDDLDTRYDAMIAALRERGVLPALAERAVDRALAATSAFGAWSALLGAGADIDPVWARDLLRQHGAFPFAGETAAAFLKRLGLPNPADRQRTTAFERYLAARRHTR